MPNHGKAARDFSVQTPLQGAKQVKNTINWNCIDEVMKGLHCHILGIYYNSTKFHQHRTAPLLLHFLGSITVGALVIVVVHHATTLHALKFYS
jgi:hypothetical protein